MSAGLTPQEVERAAADFLPALLRICLRRGGSCESTDDTAQDAVEQLLKATRSADPAKRTVFTEERHVRAWLMVCCRNLRSVAHRNAMRWVPFDPQEHHSSPEEDGESTPASSTQPWAEPRVEHALDDGTVAVRLLELLATLNASQVETYLSEVVRTEPATESGRKRLERARAVARKQRARLRVAGRFER